MRTRYGRFVRVDALAGPWDVFIAVSESICSLDIWKMVQHGLLHGKLQVIICQSVVSVFKEL